MQREFARIGLVAAFALAILGFGERGVNSDEISERATKLHFHSIVVDTHDDTTQRLMDGDFDLGPRNATGSIDIPRMKQGGLGAIFFSIWVPSKITGPKAVKHALDQINAVREQVHKHSNDLVLATTAAEIRDADQHEKIAVLIGVEGGHMINCDLGVLRNFASLSVRYMTLTRQRELRMGGFFDGQARTQWVERFWQRCRPGDEPARDDGGYFACQRQSVPRCAGRQQSTRYCFALVVPGDLRSPAQHDRRHDAGTGSEERRAADQLSRRLFESGISRCGTRGPEDQSSDRTGGAKALRRQGRLPVDRGRLTSRANTWSRENCRAWNGRKIIEHIDHAVKVAGIDHVGLGSDFDGANMPYGMEDVTKLPKITEALLQKGYSEGDVKKILGENTLRVMADVERVSRELRSRK